MTSVKINVMKAMPFVNQKNRPVIRPTAGAAPAGPLSEMVLGAEPVKWYSSKLQTAANRYRTKTDTYQRSVVKAAEASTAMREMAYRWR
jgi:hypothetical protein